MMLRGHYILSVQASVLAVLILSACAPSPGAVETAIAQTTIARDIIITQTQAALPTATPLPTTTPLPTATALSMLDGDPRDYLPALNEMPNGYFDVSALVGTSNKTSYDGKSASVAYGIVPSELAVLVTVLSENEAKAKEVFSQMSEKSPSGQPITRRLRGFDEYKALISNLGKASGASAWIVYRFRNVTGTVVIGGGLLTEDFVTQRGIQFAELISSKLTQ